ncbi:MAG: IS4 family transposase, partial [Acidobacteriota bacterium]
AKTMRFPAGAMLIFDRGYNGYEWFHSLTMQRVHFATRLKENASFVVVESRRISDSSCVRADEIIVFTKQAAADGDRFLRCVVWWDERSHREFVYLTNHLDLAAATVAAIYRERWQVELFFKSIKQNSRIKTFVGASANALKIQIWTALIALLLVRFLELRSCLKWHTSRFMAMLRRQLFVYRDLFRFLDYPFEAQLELGKTTYPVKLPYSRTATCLPMTNLD